MKKVRFGVYTVGFEKVYTKQRPDGLIETEVVISGDIEIGIDITPMTWREDWLADQVFGKGHDRVKLLNALNNHSGRTNIVVGVWKKYE